MVTVTWVRNVMLFVFVLPRRGERERPEIHTQIQNAESPIIMLNTIKTDGNSKIKNLNAEKPSLLNSIKTVADKVESFFSRHRRFEKSILK